MRIFNAVSVYDFESQEWTEKFFINDEEVDCDEYFEEMELESEEIEEENEDEDNCEDCDDCKGYCECEEIDDETQEEIKLIEHLAHTFEDSECICGACLRNTLYEAYCLGKKIGFTDCKDVFRSVVEHLDGN